MILWLDIFHFAFRCFAGGWWQAGRHVCRLELGTGSGKDGYSSEDTFEKLQTSFAFFKVYDL